MSIGVLLTTFKRPHTLRPQLEAIGRQTLEPDSLVIYHNEGGVSPDLDAMRNHRVVSENQAAGVWQRFAWCLHGFNTEFVCVLDDDTIPGDGWLQNCMTCFQAHAGLYGANGVRFPHLKRDPRTYHGFQDRCANTMQVDIVGHSWFFKREWLRAWLATPPACYEPTAGEDYHWAYVMQQMGLNCFVPPQNSSDRVGSRHPGLGTDEHALYLTPGEEDKKFSVHDAYRRLGWKPMADRPVPVKRTTCWFPVDNGGAIPV